MFFHRPLAVLLEQEVERFSKSAFSSRAQQVGLDMLEVRMPAPDDAE